MGVLSPTGKDASCESKLKPSRVSARLALGGIGCKTEEPIRAQGNRGCQRSVLLFLWAVSDCYFIPVQYGKMSRSGQIGWQSVSIWDLRSSCKLAGCLLSFVVVVVLPRVTEAEPVPVRPTVRATHQRTRKPATVGNSESNHPPLLLVPRLREETLTIWSLCYKAFNTFPLYLEGTTHVN